LTEKRAARFLESSTFSKEFNCILMSMLGRSAAMSGCGEAGDVQEGDNGRVGYEGMDSEGKEFIGWVPADTFSEE